MKKSLLVFLLLPLVLFSQNIPFVSGGRSAGLGNTSMVISDVWSITNNQGALGFLENSEIGLYYTNRFMLKELSLQSLVFAMPSKWGNWGVSMERFGYSEYFEMQFGLAYAKALNPYVSIGMKFNYLQIQQSEYYGNIRAVLVDLGILAKPYKDVILAVRVYNPSMSKFNTDLEQKVPTLMSLGIAYQIDKSVLLMAQVDNHYRAEVLYKVGVEMNIKCDLYLRAGVNLKPNAYSVGVAYYFKNIKFDLAFSYQQVIGMSPASSLGYTFNSHNE